MSDHDPIGDLLRAAARRAGDPPADLAARCLQRIGHDRRRRRLRIVTGAVGLAAAAGLAIALLRPWQAPPESAPPSLAMTPRPRPVEPIAPPAVDPGASADANAHAAPSADLRRILARTTYGGERRAILQDLDGCRAFLLACVPRIALPTDTGAGGDAQTDGL